MPLPSESRQARRAAERRVRKRGPEAAPPEMVPVPEPAPATRQGGHLRVVVPLLALALAGSMSADRGRR